MIFQGLAAYYERMKDDPSWALLPTALANRAYIFA